MEGKRRSSVDQTSSSLAIRGGSQFMSTCRRCGEVLRLLGVTVLEADAEGEMLCALLNSRGIVDGVISNDGDAFLYGARVIYKGFTLDNLMKGSVLKYDADGLNVATSAQKSLPLSREDLVAFAALSGSDVFQGVQHLGWKKAVKFLDACPDGKSLETLLEWSESDEANDDARCVVSSGTTTCSICLHPGSKSQHQKKGCTECGTEAGECCHLVTPDERFIRSVKAKSLGSLPSRDLVNVYLQPAQEPSSLISRSEASKETRVDVEGLLKSSILVKGKGLQSSVEYSKQVLPKLLVKLHLWDRSPKKQYIAKQRFVPVPTRITKALQKDHVQCYEVSWTLLLFDTEEIPFVTTEEQHLFQSNYSALVRSFKEGERERERQRHFGVTANRPGRSHNPGRDKAFKRPAGQKRKRRERTNFGVARDEQQQADDRRSSDVEFLLRNVQTREEFSQPTTSYERPAADQHHERDIDSDSDSPDDFGNHGSISRYHPNCEAASHSPTSPATKWDGSSIMPRVDDGSRRRAEDTPARRDALVEHEQPALCLDKRRVFVDMGFQVEITPVAVRTRQDR